MKKSMKFISLILVMACIFSSFVYAGAVNNINNQTPNDVAAAPTGSENHAVSEKDFMTDILLRGDSVPTSFHDLTLEDYSSDFQIYNWSYTGKYFRPNSNGQLYYYIYAWNTTQQSTVEVKSYCKTCDEHLTTFSTTCGTYSNPLDAHRVVTVGSAHNTHDIYLEITNDYVKINGDITVSHSYV